MLWDSALNTLIKTPTVGKSLRRITPIESQKLLIVHLFSLTVPPAVEFSLQPLDDAFQALVLLLLLLVFLLPLLSRQLQVHGHRVLDGLGSKRSHTHTERSEVCLGVDRLF